MKRTIVLTYLGIYAACAAYAQDPTLTSFVIQAGGSTMLVQAPEPDSAFDYLERTLADIDFFRANNYEVSLPDHPLFDGTTISTTDPAERRAIFTREVYRLSEFDTALTTLSGHRKQLRTALERISSWAAHDGFESRDSVTVTLTLYGPGGSFDPDAGHIVLWTNAQGMFKGGGGLHTIIHEMIHVAIEHGIARPLQLQHWERERLVDLLARREFPDLLPDYRPQGGDDEPMDRFVANVDLSSIRDAVAQYVQVGRTN